MLSAGSASNQARPSCSPEIRIIDVAGSELGRSERRSMAPGGRNTLFNKAYGAQTRAARRYDRTGGTTAPSTAAPTMILFFSNVRTDWSRSPSDGRKSKQASGQAEA